MIIIARQGCDTRSRNLYQKLALHTAAFYSVQVSVASVTAIRQLQWRGRLASLWSYTYCCRVQGEAGKYTTAFFDKTASKVDRL